MSSRSLNVTVDDFRLKDRYQLCLNKLGALLNAVQTEEYDGKKKNNKSLMDEVESIYNEAGLKVFSETLFRMMIVPFQSKDSPYVSRVIEFFLDIVTDERWEEAENSPNDTIRSNNTTMSSTIDDGSSESLPMRILRMCEKYHVEGRTLIRQRIMQTIVRIIPGRIQVNGIRRGLQARLIKMLLNRIKDKAEQIRAMAGAVLCSFLDDNVPFRAQVLESLLVRMAHDPEPNVRAKIVSFIKIMDETLEHVVERTGDPNANVRAAAIARVTESIQLSSLTLEMREAILKANTTDESPKNIQKAVTSMLEHWLRCLKNDPCEFLRILNVRRRPKLCRTALNNLYNQPPEEAYLKISQALLKDKKYPEESLCMESTFLWLYLFERFKDDEYNFNKLSFPVTEMIEYIKEYLDVVEEEGELPQAELDYRSWMLGDMMQILSYLPVEEGGRQAILDFLPTLYLKKKLMDIRNSAIGVKLISVCSDIQNESTVIELVNAVIDSDRPPSSLGRSTRKSLSIAFNSIKSEDSLKDMQLELGSLTHKLKKLERDKRIAIGENDLYKADVCQDEIEEIEKKVEDLKRSIGEASPNVTITDSPPTEEEDDKWHYSDKTMLIAMSIVKTNILLLNNISDFSRTFYEMYVVKAVSKCLDPVVRALALEVMCIVGTDYEKESSRATLFCLMALLHDNIIVKETALKCLYDLILRYSFKILGESEEVKGALMGDESIKIKDAGNPGATLKALLLSYIRHEEQRLVKVSVAGILKILFRHELSKSSKIITNFLLNWAIPTYVIKFAMMSHLETQLRFKEVGTMVPVYARLSEQEAAEVAHCLIDCIKKIQVKTHSFSSTSEKKDEVPPADVDKIINLVVKSTDPVRLTEFQRPYVGHEIIANAALQELRKVDLTTEEKTTFAKLLKILDLRQCPAESINQMTLIVADVADTTSRTVSQTLAGFSRYLESLGAQPGDGLSGVGAFDDDEDAMSVQD